MLVKKKLRTLEIPVTAKARTAEKAKISGTLRGSFLAAYAILSTALGLWPQTTMDTVGITCIFHALIHQRIFDCRSWRRFSGCRKR